MINYIENEFKKGKLLFIKENFEMSLNHFYYVIDEIENIFKKSLIFPKEVDFLLLSLQHIGKIFEKQNKLKKSFLFHSLYTKFVQFISENKDFLEPPGEKSFEIDSTIYIWIEELFYQYNEGKKYEEIIKNHLLQENEIINDLKDQYNNFKSQEKKKSLEIFKEIAKLNQKSIQKSFFHKFISFIDSHLYYLFVICLIILLLIFIPFILSLKFKPKKVFEILDHHKKETHTHDHHQCGLSNNYFSKFVQIPGKNNHNHHHHHEDEKML